MSSLRAERLIGLTRAIEEHPNEVVNYVVRGELYLDMGERERAAEDFQRALLLADAQFEKQRWGFVTQTLRDRVQAGLWKI
jgi:tetratricopeptide (TPR) repeat protein